MYFKIRPSHVAILVPSVRQAVQRLKPYDFQIGPEEVWEGEGTREVYVEREKGNSLLLMEPVAEGAYQRALEKRGPGLHHVAIDVLDIDLFLESLEGSRWLLHPITNRCLKQSRSAYLARPGFPALIEVQQVPQLQDKPLFIERVSLPLEPGLDQLISPLGLESLLVPQKGEISLSLGGVTLNLRELIESQ